MPHGTAEAVGIRAGDVVGKVESYAIQGVTEFTAILYRHPADWPLHVDALRGVQ
jgi:S1-C subfamily serine protease